MEPNIRRYLDEHGDTYTVEALRAGLIEAGHEPSTVQSALEEWQREAGNRGGAADEPRRTFDRVAAWIHVGALALVVLVAAAIVGPASAVTIGVVLGVALLVGWAISRAIGRALLSRTTVAAALIVPAASAILIGGTCLAMFGGLGGI